MKVVRIRDAVIIGGGPGGTSAAYELASAGADVTLLEKMTYPRPKVCGGALSSRITEFTGSGFLHLTRHIVTRARLTYGGSRSITFESDEPVAYLVMREEFDTWMADRASNAGAEIRDGVKVQDVETTGDRVRVRAGRDITEARYIIAADGANSMTARKYGLGPDLPWAVGLESEITRQETAEAYDEIMTIDIGVSAGGYGWIFPKGDHLNVGVAGIRNSVPGPRQLFRQFLSDTLPFADLQHSAPAGHLIPVYRNPPPRIAGDRILAIGDAGGLIDPFLGEGIYYAVWSGVLAAEAITSTGAGDNSPAEHYAGSVSRHIFPELESAGKIANIIYRYPSVAVRFLQKRPGLVSSLFRILQGEYSYQEFWPALRRSVTLDFFRTRFNLFPRSA